MIFLCITFRPVATRKMYIFFIGFWLHYQAAIAFVAENN